MKLGIRTKIIIVTTAVFLFATAVNTFLSTRMFRREYSAALISEMQVIGRNLKSQIQRMMALGISVNDIEGFEKQCLEVIRKHKDVTYAMVVSTNGSILFHNNPSLHGTTITAPEVLKALEEGREKICTSLSGLDQKVYYNTIIPIENDAGEVNIAAIVGFPAELIDFKVQNMMSFSFWVAVISLAIAMVILMFSLSASVTKPLYRLVATIQEIRKTGNLGKRVQIHSGDEIGQLADTFNKMAEDLKNTTTSIDNLNREITERKMAQKELARTKDRLQYLLTSSPAIIYACETNGNFAATYISENILEQFGYRTEEFLGNPNFWIDHIHPEDKESVLSCLQDILEKRHHNHQYRFQHKNGTYRWVFDELKLTTDKKGDPGELIGSMIDITHRKEAEEALEVLNNELKAMVAKLKSVNTELADFAHIVAHDLKAPLRAIGTLAGMLIEDYRDKLDEQGQKQLGLLIRRTKRMSELINGILKYSEVGRFSNEKEQVDLNQVVEEVISNIAPPENIEIKVENELPTIISEKTRILQAFQNLLGNAIKYIDKPQGLIKIGCVEENDFWKFYISDNGPGIEEKYFEKIFKIFQTLSRRDEVESTGIGLTMVKKIIKLYNGKIWVESKLGQGSTFFFTLPKRKMEVKKHAKLQTNIVG